METEAAPAEGWPRVPAAARVHPVAVAPLRGYVVVAIGSPNTNLDQPRPQRQREAAPTVKRDGFRVRHSIE